MSEAVLMKAAALMVGDRVDLEGDTYADPKRDNPYFEAEYVIVDGIELETPGCVRVDLEGDPSFGFPPEHQLKVRDRSLHPEDFEPLDED